MIIDCNIYLLKYWKRCTQSLNFKISLLKIKFTITYIKKTKKSHNSLICVIYILIIVIIICGVSFLRAQVVIQTLLANQHEQHIVVS